MSPEVVLVPGLGLDGRSAARLRDRLTVPLLPVDVLLLPGAGRRAPVPPLPDLAARVRAALGAGPVVLVGHSQGCQVAAAAATDPRVAALVLLGPTTAPELRSPLRLAARWVATALGEPWEQVPRLLGQWLTTGPRAMRALWRVASPDRLDARLRGVGVPVTVVRGTRDRLCPPGWAAALAAAAPRGRLVELPGAGHMAVQTHPAAVAAVLRAVHADVAPPGDDGG
ncbi:alpha/beta fold hydrolase [Geodermatophilus marinus]|uniref:alpha/beta fold hydrolase n=1 Tax=Geodermatophilus sp. LHW52908 TaxID=2303986 RepID=UPI0013147807|nr:alpha/beta hydrolase [Geodermatophilus sp. LHW52908]